VRSAGVAESSRDRRAIVAGWWAWGATGLAAAITWAWLGGMSGAPVEPVCLFYRVTHVSCPTCGMTRALLSLAHGDWRAALAFHPWAIALVAQVLVGWMAWMLALTRALIRPDRYVPAAVALNAGALAVLWLVRLASGTLPSASG
jgi:hypothetical protein